MSVIVILAGHLGSNWFQYLVGRDLAERSGLALTCEVEYATRHRLPRMGGPWTLADLASSFPNAPLSLPGISVEAPVETFQVSADSDWKGQMLPPQAIEAVHARRCVRLKGHFERFDHVAPALQKHREWFDTMCRPSLTITSADVLVDVWRTRDYGLNGWLLPMSYYVDALERMRHVGQVFVIGTGIDDEVRTTLEPFAPVYLELPAIERFSLGRSFRRFVLSNSTLAWWSALLSDATEIYAPRAVGKNGYAFTGFGDVDLHMRSSRYVEVPVPRFVSASYIVESHVTGASLLANQHSIVVALPHCPSRRVASNAALPLLQALVRREQTTLRDLRNECGRALLLLDDLEDLGLVSIHE